MDAARYSLASDIVELVVLTDDGAFLQTLREAVGPSRRLWHVPSSDKVGDLLLAGGVGILVLDAPALRDPCTAFVTQMERQFPDLVVVVAGTRDEETELARLISDGTVYRFIHKPMSPARAKLFVDAAVKRLEEQRRRAGETAAAAAAAPAAYGGLVVAGGCVALCAIAGGLWALTHADREMRPEPAPGTATLEEEMPALAAVPRAELPPGGGGLPTRTPQALAAKRAGADGARVSVLAAEPAPVPEQPAGKTSAAVEVWSAAAKPAARAAAAGPGPAADTGGASAQATADTGGGSGQATEDAGGASAQATAAIAAAESAARAAAAQAPTGRGEDAAAGAPPSNAAVDASRLVLVKAVQPEYPREARQRALEGWVELEFTVAESGQVKDLSVRDANPPGVFDRAARNALSQWRYQPLLIDSKPVAQRARIRIRFALAG